MSYHVFLRNFYFRYNYVTYVSVLVIRHTIQSEVNSSTCRNLRPVCIAFCPTLIENFSFPTCAQKVYAIKQNNMWVAERNSWTGLGMFFCFVTLIQQKIHNQWRIQDFQNGERQPKD